MPNRILREGILYSERVDALPLLAELFYRRLMSVVDDYGRIEANRVLLRSRVYPLKTESVSLDDIEGWMAACRQEPALIVEYKVKGKAYLQIENFCQQKRAEKHPGPALADPPLANASKREQPLANAHLGVVVFGGVVEGEGGGVVDRARKEKPPPEKTDPPVPAELSQRNPVTLPDSHPVETIGAWMRQYGEHMRVPLEPDAAACQRICGVMLQAGKNLDHLEGIFQDLYESKAKPKSVGWLITVLEGKLGGAPKYAAS